jgi:uncharacterized protein (UPF0335 family)
MMDTMLLPVDLTTTEVAVKADMLAATVKEIDALEMEKKSFNADIKMKIDQLEMKRTDLATEINDRREYRQVDVKRIRNEERATIDTVRIDTGEVVNYRPMEPTERTKPLPFAVEPSEIRDQESGAS